MEKGKLHNRRRNAAEKREKLTTATAKTNSKKKSVTPEGKGKKDKPSG